MVGAKVEEVKVVAKVRQTVGAKGRYRAEVRVKVVHMYSMHPAALDPTVNFLNVCNTSSTKLWLYRTCSSNLTAYSYSNP